MQTLRGWQFVGAGKPLMLLEREAPEPGPGEVLIKVRGSGLCHSDVTELIQGSGVAYSPIILGHEIAGEVVAVGLGVRDWNPGDRVAVCPTAGGTIPGYSRDGGFANLHLAPAHQLVAIPESIDWTLGAMMTDAGMTSYHALVKRGECGPGTKTGIIGFGGLGQLAARVAVITGAEVHVAEQKQSVWPLIEEAGVENIVSDAAEWEGEDFDLIVDYAGFGSTTRAAIRAVKFDGAVVQVGLGRTEITLSTADMVQKKVRLLASNGGTPDDIRELYDLIEAGQLDPAVSDVTFQGIPEGLAALARGEVSGRLVARLD